ncbi:MAG: orotate phosphoribosyltransferase [Chitinispirillales bacterium]|nr:orotate phosphoribosyltransferase [Chitinispirillales bacterium]
MDKYKQDFIEFMVECEVLTFGDFITKSGRKTPYFINTGRYKTGAQIAKLGEFYAEAITKNFSDYNALFGPAYKGIPLSVTTAIALTKKNINVGFCFNRKEIKDHGEGGTLIGYNLKDGDKVLMIEDVTTAGTSIAETLPILKNIANVTVGGLIVSVDRQEKGGDGRGAFTLIEQDYKITPKAIVCIDDIVEFGYKRRVCGKILIDDDTKRKIDDYRSRYGVCL